MNQTLDISGSPVESGNIQGNWTALVKSPKFKQDNFSKRAFAVYEPLVWNCLPKEIRFCDEK